MARIIALDIGAKRTGVAVTDPMKIIANALTTVATQELIQFLKEYFKNEEVELLVVGEPKQMDNTASESAVLINEVVEKIKKEFANLPIKRVDERFTSKMASQVIAQSGKSKKERQNKSLIDTISATIILQSYMESNF